MALTPIFIDPAINANSGAGTLLDPFGDLAYGIRQTVFDTTNGTLVCVKSGTDEILTRELSLELEDTSVTPAWVPTSTAHCVIRGYTAAAQDGGIGGISGNGLVAIYDEGVGKDYVHFVDMHLHNTGANKVLTLDDYCSATNCHVEDSSVGGIEVSIWGAVHRCYINNVGGTGIVSGERSDVTFNFVRSRAADVNTMTAAIDHRGPGLCGNNLVSVDSVTKGIGVRQTFCEHNTVWSNGGSGQGIYSAAANSGKVCNNYVEGFSSVGGVGYDLTQTAGYSALLYQGNSAYGNTTNFNDPDTVIYTSGNKVETESALTDPLNDDFSSKAAIQEASVPSTWNTG